MAALSGWGSIRRFLGVPLPPSLPLKRVTTSLMYEEKRHARHQLQAQNGTTIGIDPASVDNTLGIRHTLLVHEAANSFSHSPKALAADD